MFSAQKKDTRILKFLMVHCFFFFFFSFCFTLCFKHSGDWVQFRKIDFEKKSQFLLTFVN